MSSDRTAAALLLMALALGCEAPSVEWTAQRLIERAPADRTVDVSGAVVADSMALLARRLAPPGPGAACAGSLRVARLRGALVGAWWAPRADSSAALVAARSTDEGRSWSAVAPVDTLDRSVSGCRREPPSLAGDSASGYVHVAYALLAPEGPGLFFSHSMDGGATFHAPVPILYGDRLGRTSVASDGDEVVVAFEDPNSRTSRIGIAMSHTMGHIFEDRIVPVSPDQGIAAHPMTAIRGRRLAVGWEQRTAEGAPAALVVRVGALR